MHIVLVSYVVPANHFSKIFRGNTASQPMLISTTDVLSLA